MERFVIPYGVLDQKYLDNLNIECLKGTGTEMQKVPDINIIECGKIDRKFKVFFRIGETVHIICETEKQNDAENGYQKTINAIIKAYNNRKSKDYTGLGNLSQSDIQKTLISVTPNIIR